MVRNKVLILLVFLITFCKKAMDNEIYLEPVNVSNNSGCSQCPSIAIDSKGTVHLVWQDNTLGNEEIFYAFKPKSARWSKPINISNDSYPSYLPKLKVDKNDNLHIVWCGSSQRIFYRQRRKDGKWSILEIINTVEPIRELKIDVDSVGRVFMIWSAWTGDIYRIYFSVREINGVWTPPVPIISGCQGEDIKGIAINVDKKGNIHVVFTQGKGRQCIFYIMRDTKGVWSQPLNILPADSMVYLPVLTSDKEENIHVSWYSFFRLGFVYMYKSLQGDWSLPEHPDLVGFPWDIAVDENGTVYICYSFTKLVKKPKNGNWEKPFIVVQRKDENPSYLVIDNFGIKHIAYHSNEEVYYVEVKDY